MIEIVGQTGKTEEQIKAYKQDCNGCFGIAENDCQKCQDPEDVTDEFEKGEKMKYSIETTKNGCIETFEMLNGKKYEKKSERTRRGLRQNCEFAEEMAKDMGDEYDEDILDLVSELFDGCFALDFVKLLEKMEGYE